MLARRIAVPTLLALLLAACGDPPQKLEPPAPGAASAAHSAGDGHDHGAPTQDSPSWKGVIVLDGPRAEASDWSLFVSLRSVAGGPPFWVTKIGVGTGALEAGKRRVPFVLSRETDMMKMQPQLPQELQGAPLQLSVRLDRDGIIDTRDEGDAGIAVPVGWGAEGLEIPIGG